MMATNDIEEQPAEKKRSKKELNKFKNKLGCFLMIIIGIFFLTYTVPGFLAYREQRRLEEAERWSQVIQKALAEYKENQKNQSYPLNISDWQTLIEIAGSQGINLPDTSLAAKIKAFRYESVNGSDYLLTIDVDIPEDTYRDRFLLVTPNEVTRHKNRP
jgi:type II secretory pathway pseudopilin PulG